MGWQDGNRFYKWFKEKVGRVWSVKEEEIIKEAYDAGYKNGFVEGRNYDPLWDSD